MDPNKPTPALSSNTKNPNLDDEDASPGAIRAELKRINKTLKLSAIRRHEPYKYLPYQYLPNPDIDHCPPVFMYGPAFSFEEIKEYVFHPDSPIPPEMAHAFRMDPLIPFVRHLRAVFGVPDTALPWYFAECDDSVVFRFMTNYNRYGVSNKQVAEIIATCERLFQRTPVWYISPVATPKKDYRIPESKFRLI